MNSVLYSLVIRNLKKFLRDRASVFFSFLSVIIILLLYILFLGKMQIDSVTNEMGDIDGIGWLVSSWIMSGILMVSTVTVPLGAIGGLIDDRHNNVLDDFYVSPVSRHTIALSYLISAWVIAFILVCVNLVIGQIYVLSQGGELLSLFTLVKIFGLVIFSIMTFTSFFFYLATVIKTRNAFGTLSTIVGTFIGFLGGIYIPIGVLSKNVQNVMNVLPTAHAVTIIRSVYMKGAVQEVFGNTSSQIYNEYARSFGLKIVIGNFEMQNWHMLLSMAVFMLIFYVLSILKLSKSKL
ncbi:MAG: ABC transporter permease [Tenericutes bacterium]|jgi:multidrug/hemolysin transport system permease protein|nr:ABC transporter permease [Mycoplasmatota bacterium]